MSTPHEVATARQLRVLEQRYAVEPNTGCWLWLGTLSSDGYGYMRVGRYPDGTVRRAQAHRLAYEHWKGSIADGLEIDHLCRQRCCINPDHLEAVSHQENCRRGDLGGHGRNDTHCANGHPFSGHNLIVSAKTGRRRCRECQNARVRRVYASRRQEVTDVSA